MINHIFEYKLDIKQNTTVQKFYITTPKEFKYITRMAIIPFIDCSNGCPDAMLSVIDNSNIIAKKVSASFFFIENPLEVDALIKSALRVNIKASQNLFELIWDTGTMTYTNDSQVKLILWASDTPEDDYYYEGHKISILYNVNYKETEIFIPRKYSLQKFALNDKNNRYDFDLTIQSGATVILDKVWAKILAFKAKKNFENKFENIEINSKKIKVQLYRFTANPHANDYDILILMKKNDNNQSKAIRTENIFQK